jgi:hypothetical protein
VVIVISAVAVVVLLAEVVVVLWYKCNMHWYDNIKTDI